MTTCKLNLKTFGNTSRSSQRIFMLSPTQNRWKYITHPHRSVEDFADHFSSSSNSPSSVVIPNNAWFNFFNLLNYLSIFDSDVKQTIRRLGPSKCVCPDEIPSFIIESCSEIFALILRRIFNISELQGKFPALCKQPVVMPVFKKVTVL
jgi:hypothetical protein